MDLDAQLLASRPRAAVELVADLLIEPDAELLSLRDLDEGGHGGLAASEPGERPGPLDRIPGRHHPQLEPPVVRSRLGESLDPAEYLADVRGPRATRPAPLRRDRAESAGSPLAGWRSPRAGSRPPCPCPPPHRCSAGPCRRRPRRTGHRRPRPRPSGRIGEICGSSSPHTRADRSRPPARASSAARAGRRRSSCAGAPPQRRWSCAWPLQFLVRSVGPAGMHGGTGAQTFRQRASHRP